MTWRRHEGLFGYSARSADIGGKKSAYHGLMFDVMIGMDPAEAKQIWLDAVDDLLRVHE